VFLCLSMCVSHSVYIFLEEGVSLSVVCLFLVFV